MRIGALIFLTDLSISPVQLARELEERGFESLWVPEHTHIPTSRRTPYPAGEPLPDEYRRTLDPFVALTAAAGATERLQLGTGICLVAQHNPINLAKSVASVDLVSNGRMIFGIGVGWNADEMEDHGVKYGNRREHVRESILAMKGLWTQEEAGYDGKYVRFAESWAWPKPLQKPHPPVIMGGAGGPVTFRHIVEYCDGWMPIHRGQSSLARLPELQAAAEAAGRDPSTIELGMFGIPPKMKLIESYASAGVTRCVLALPPAGPDLVLTLRDQYADLISEANSMSE